MFRWTKHQFFGLAKRGHIKEPVDLPINSVLPTLLSELKKGPNLVLKAPTGAGKTTRVPPAILKAGLTDGLVLVIEPRRLAARATARRMAQEAGESLGEQFGYQVRFDRRCGSKTRVIAMTPGMLIRKLQGDPFLEDVGVIIFDEFHERGLDNDLGFAMACLLQETVRPELKLVVMSATLDVEKISAHLSNCPMVESEGRLFPVDIKYQSRKPRDRLEDAVEIAVDRLLEETNGDVLVFLPGKGDIRKCEDRLSGGNFDVYPLHGELSPEQQDNALKAGNRRKVVLSTNVAESSVTVEGVTGVVDSGFAKVLNFDNGLELNRLDLQGISQASADQRAGRAGRLSPGVCIRLWSQSEQRSRPKQQEPELLRVELSQTLLILLGLGEQSFEEFPWLDKPREASLEKALQVLQRLGAVNEKRELTDLGRQLLKLPLEPRLGRLLIEGVRLGQSERVALGAAILSERSPFQRDRDRPIKSHSRSDWLDQIEGLEDFLESRTRHSDLGTIHKGAARTLFKLQGQYLKNLRRLSKSISVEESGLDEDEAVLRSLLAAFPDRVARRREAKSEKARMVGGRGIRLSKQSRVWDAELFLCLDIDGGRQEAWARMASGVERSWLDADKIRKSIDIEFDEENERLSARERLYYEDLLLEESPAPLPKGDALTEACVVQAGRRFERVMPG
ncbi:MAG: ATP-dependent helicase HrpB, partial [Planctomycetota bacterium]|nr:ATP-dependent helicase HrpB [Planctomycetota bacterium]